MNHKGARASRKKRAEDKMDLDEDKMDLDEDKMDLDEEDTSAQRARVRRKHTVTEQELNRKAAGGRKKRADLDSGEQTANRRRQLFVGGF
jgi:hypothetical protein